MPCEPCRGRILVDQALQAPTQLTFTSLTGHATVGPKIDLSFAFFAAIYIFIRGWAVKKIDAGRAG